jgi:hypothetical protein
MAMRILHVVLGIVVWGIAGVAAADESSPWERYSIDLGAFFSDSDTELRFDSDDLGIGATIDPKETFGMDTEDTNYRIDAFWRFGSTRRHQLEVHYFNVDNAGSRTLDLNTQIGNVIFPNGAAVNSQLQLQFINVNYSYAFFQDDRMRLAGAIGIDTTAFDFNVNAPRQGLAVSETFTSPVPVFGLRGDFIVTPRWRVKASTDLIYLPLNEYDVSVSDSLLAIEYLPFEHAGIGLGLNNVRYRIDSDSLDVDGKARLQFLGALAYLKLRF